MILFEITVDSKLKRSEIFVNQNDGACILYGILCDHHPSKNKRDFEDILNRDGWYRTNCELVYDPNSKMPVIKTKYQILTEELINSLDVIFRIQHIATGKEFFCIRNSKVNFMVINDNKFEEIVHLNNLVDNYYLIPGKITITN